MNHWFQINLTTPAWIITRKGGPRPNYIQVSAYDLNYNPIQGRMIFEADSISGVNANGQTYYPYVGHVMGSESYFYNNFNPRRVDLGNDLYFPLEVGSYLLCVSSTRNEPLDYSLGIVIEVADISPFLLLEDYSFFLFEDGTDLILCDLSDTFTGFEEHEHSLSEWEAAWNREHPPDVKFPDVFIPLATRPWCVSTTGLFVRFSSGVSMYHQRKSSIAIVKKILVLPSVGFTIAKNILIFT